MVYLFQNKEGKLAKLAELHDRGVLTDTDNTGERTEAYYGDIQLLPPLTGS